MKIKKDNAKFGKYPSCDHLNYALQSLLADENYNETAVKEIYCALLKAGGYFYESVIEKLKEKGVISREVKQ